MAVPGEIIGIWYLRFRGTSTFKRASVVVGMYKLTIHPCLKMPRCEWLVGGQLQVKFSYPIQPNTFQMAVNYRSLSHNLHIDLLFVNFF